MKQKITEEELTAIIKRSGVEAIYGYTPMCATCKLAESFLNIATKVIDVNVTKIDLNYYEAFIQQYKIHSVPALLIFKDGKLQEEVYAFESVTKIVEIFKKYVDNENS